MYFCDFEDITSSETELDKALADIKEKREIVKQAAWNSTLAGVGIKRPTNSITHCVSSCHRLKCNERFKELTQDCIIPQTWPH